MDPEILPPLPHGHGPEPFEGDDSEPRSEGVFRQLLRRLLFRLEVLQHRDLTALRIDELRDDFFPIRADAQKDVHGLAGEVSHPFRLAAGACDVEEARLALEVSDPVFRRKLIEQKQSF